MDDDPFFLSMWQEALPSCRVFSSPEEVLAKINELDAHVKSIVLDYTFDNSDMNGIQLAEELVKQCQKVPALFLCSDRTRSKTPRDLFWGITKEYRRSRRSTRKV